MTSGDANRPPTAPVPPGTYELVVTAARMATATRDVTVRADAVTPVLVELAASPPR